MPPPHVIVSARTRSSQHGDHGRNENEPARVRRALEPEPDERQGKQRANDGDP